MFLILIFLLILGGSVAIETPSYKNENKSDKHNIYSAQIGFHANIYHDLYLLKNSMKTVEDQINKLNNLLDTKFDQKLSSFASTISNMDANIKNIQDKARIWDVFQHHISAWNEQIKSLDRKIDIISSGQEKMLLLDGKLGFLINLEYNSQRTINKLSIIEDRLELLEKNTNKDIKVPSIFGEFATRGMLSTLKTLENKVDRSNLLLHQLVSNKKAREKNSNETESHYLGKGKYIVTCAMPTVIEEFVKDMSSKIDLVYDKIVTDANEDDENSSTENSIENEYPEENFQSDEESSKKPIIFTKSEKKAVRKIFKYICSNKKMELVLKEIYTNKEFLKNISEILAGYDEYSSSSSFDVTKGAFYINLKKLIDYKNDKILFELKNFEKSTEISSNLKDYINEVVRNISVMCQNRLVTEKHKGYFDHTISTPSYIGDSTTISDSIRFPQNDKYDYSTSTSPNLDENEKFDTTTEFQFISTTSSFDTNYESEVPSIDDVYYTNVLDLSNDIVKRISLSNYTIDFCQNPGSERYCDDEGYFTIQHRVDKSVNFSKSWNEYKNGFGDLESGNFWIGNEAIYSLTLDKNEYSFPVLKIELEDFDGNKAIAQYDNFKVASEKYFYKLTIGDYSGNASDSLTYHNNTEFSTYDKTNDRAPSCCPCSNSYGGGWWFQSCFESNLNGLYYDKSTEDDFRGIIWEHWSGETSLAKTRMSVKTISNWKNRKLSVEEP